MHNPNPFDGFNLSDPAIASFKKASEEFDALAALGPHLTKDRLAEFLRSNPGEPDLAAELILDHFRPRVKNQRGCTCRPEDGEGCTRCCSWHNLFHGNVEVEQAPPITFAIDGFLQNDAISMIGGLPGHSKTFVMLSMVKALLEGKPLFGYEGFAVREPAKKVVYLCPESSLTPFADRLKRFDLAKHVRAPGKSRFFVRTMSRDMETLRLDDLRLRHAIDGAHVFLDTAVRFMDGDENSASDQRAFAKTLFQLLNAGAKSITAAHHAPKGSETIPADRLSLESILRGTGELGAMVATCWAIKQTDKAVNRVYVRNVKARDFEPVGDFAITGRPFINQTGDFKMVARPGMAVAPTVERLNKAAGRRQEAQVMRQAGYSPADIAKHFGVTERAVFKWFAAEQTTEQTEKPSS